MLTLSPLEQKIHHRNLVQSARNYMKGGRPIPGELNRELAVVLGLNWDSKNRIFVGEYVKQNAKCANDDAVLPIDYVLYDRIEYSIRTLAKRIRYGEHEAKPRKHDAEQEYNKAIERKLSNGVRRVSVKKAIPVAVTVPDMVEQAINVLPDAAPVRTSCGISQDVIVSHNKVDNIILLDDKPINLDIPMNDISVNIHLNGYALHLFGRCEKFNRYISAVVISGGTKFENVSIVRTPVGQLAFRTENGELQDFTSRAQLHRLAHNTPKFAIQR